MILTHTGLLREFLWETTGLDYTPRGGVAFGWVRRGEITAAIAFTRVSKVSAEVTIVSRGLLPRELLNLAFRYAFGQCGLRRLTGCIASNNLTSIRLISHLGAELEATLAGTHPDCDTQIWVIRPETCSYWRRLNGIKRFRPTNA